MRRVDRILAAVELGFAVPLMIAYLVLCLQLPSGMLWGLADGANQVLGSMLGLSSESARWRREGYWFQEAVLTLIAAAGLYPVTARASARLLGMVGVAMPLSAVGVMIAVQSSSQTVILGVLGWVVFAWAFGGLSAWGLPRERESTYRRVMIGGIGVTLLASASLLPQYGSPFLGVSTWGASVLGIVAYWRWALLTGCLTRGASHVA